MIMCFPVCLPLFFNYSSTRLISSFKKNFLFQKMAAILNFQVFGKNTKLLISPNRCEIERFRQNFLPPGYLIMTICPYFKKLQFRKMAAILNFRILVHVYICSAWATITLKNICLYLYIFAEYFASLKR